MSMPFPLFIFSDQLKKGRHAYNLHFHLYNLAFKEMTLYQIISVGPDLESLLLVLHIACMLPVYDVIAHSS